MQKVFSGNSLSKETYNEGKLLCFIYCDEKGKFSIDPEAFATLQLVKGPVDVVSVCGQAHQRKGFILNQLLRRSSGFKKVSATHQPNTYGIWMWSEPLRSDVLYGTENNVLLLDSEIGAYDEGMGGYNTEIISMSILLSCMFIYNQMGDFNEAALDRLSIVTDMIKHVLMRASGEMTTTSELGRLSPIFVWLLRDFYLDLVEDNSKITPNDYLELALMPAQSDGKDAIAKNEILEYILTLFRERECFALVRPLNNENKLQQLDQLSMDTLCPEFRSGLDAFVKFVFENTRLLQIGCTTMSGPILADLTQSFLNAFNNGVVPAISSSWQAAESVMKNYDDLLARKLEIEELTVKLDAAKLASSQFASSQLFEKKARILEQEKTHLEQKYMSDTKRFEEVQERCRLAGKYAKSAIALADKAQIRKQYLSIGNDMRWFPAQVYNSLSCSDAEVCYDGLTDTFSARYPPYDPWEEEEGLQWDRIRTPPVDTLPHQLHVSDCRNDLHPGDHIEIQWRMSKEYPYGWWYGVIGHLETCPKNEDLCFCYHDDIVVVEFNQYISGSHWRQTTINRKGYHEEGDLVRGFYGGVRKLYSKGEISVWTRYDAPASWNRYHPSSFLYF